MTAVRSTVAFVRRFSSVQPTKKFNADSFGSLHRSDIRIEKLRFTKAHDFEAPVRVRKVKELRVPVSLSKKKREELEKLQSQEPIPPGHLCFIECSRPEFNLLESERGVSHSLCSQFWAKNKYSDDWFMIKRKSKEVTSQFDRWENAWDHYVPDRLHPLVKEVLAELGLKTPTQVQTQCLQVFPSRFHLFIAAETGSGKTIAFAAPLITKLLGQKQKGVAEKAVVLAVTSSLKEQTFAVLSKLASRTDLKISMCNLHASCSEEWDILVGTPGLVEKHFRERGGASEVKHLILDEADMLLDESFTDVLTEIFALIPVANSVTNSGGEFNGARVVFCSASCPEELECLADGVVERQWLRYIKSPKLHSLLHNVEMKFIRVREKDKITRLIELLSKDMKRGDVNQTMVFCKDRATASFVHQQLQAFDHTVSLWKSADSNEEDARVFVATDVAARGTDLPCLSHVINYDFARHNVDFLHRIGRVGRLSSRFLGRVTSFIRTPREVRLTNAVELAARLGRPLPNIEADVSGEIKRAKQAEENP